MANAARNAILRALIEGAITDLMVKTKVDNVYVDDSTTLAAKLAEMITSLNSKASTSALSGKADAEHSHSIGHVANLSSELANRPTMSVVRTEIASQVSAAISELIDGAPGTYDTLKEIADYIATHEDVVDALNAAIGNKADASTVATIQATVSALGALAQKSAVSESDLDSALKEKVNAAAGASHSHSNKSLLDTYTQTEANLADAVSKKHSHSNTSVLDGITADQVSAWDGKGKFYAQASQPSSMTESDLWAQLI